MPYASRICSIFPLWMESKALVKSTNINVACRFFARTPSRILRMVNICEVVDLFLLKPFWFFLSMLSILGSIRYLGSSVESTEKDIETRLTKAWTAINRLSTIWKSDLTDKMKRSFFQAAVTSILLYGCTTWDANKTAGEETRWQLHKNAACNPEQVLAATPHKTPTVRPLASYHENYSS